MKHRGFMIALGAVCLLAACAMPQPQGVPVPGGPSMPSGSSGSSGTSGPQSPGDSSPAGSSAGGSGMPGTPTPPGSAGDPAASAGSAGSPSAGSPGGADGGTDSIGGEPLPWPGQPGETGGGATVGDLDARLEESLGDFDQTILAGGGGAGQEEEIDILDPVGRGGSAASGNQPVFVEADLDESGSESGAGSLENIEVAQRAEAGGGGGGAGGEQSGASAAGGSASGGGAGAMSGSQRGGSGAEGAEAGGADDIPIPGDVGDGRNDDIVLRQIRDAASKERDPVLREKLWDEYRRIQAQR